MKAKDFIDIIEYTRAFKEPKMPKVRNKKEEPSDPFKYIYQMKRAADEWETFLKEQEKINKKEDKKDEPKKGWEAYSPIQKFVILTATVPTLIAFEVALVVNLVLRMTGAH